MSVHGLRGVNPYACTCFFRKQQGPNKWMHMQAHTVFTRKAQQHLTQEGAQQTEKRERRGQLVSTTRSRETRSQVRYGTDVLTDRVCVWDALLTLPRKNEIVPI